MYVEGYPQELEAPKKKRRHNPYFKYPLLILAKGTKLVKAVKSVKIFLTLGTGLLSILAYSFALGFWFSAGFVGMIFVHEMGHVVALKRKGLKASAPVFIPFLGAAIFAPSFGSRDDEAYMGYGGPLVGGGFALLLLAATWWLNPSNTIALIIYTAFFINLFNMLPIRPLDGGRVTQAVGPWFKYVGLVVLIGGTVALRIPNFLLIWVLVLGDFRMPRFMRGVLAWGIWVVMTYMLLNNVGVDQPSYINYMDIGLGFLFCLMYSTTPLYDSEEAKDQRVQLSRQRKFFWLAMYLLLTVVLVLGMVLSAQNIPIEAK